jgi:hypothetical protein
LLAILSDIYSQYEYVHTSTRIFVVNNMYKYGYGILALTVDTPGDTS